MDERPTVLSVFSGIGGIDLGLERAGWRVIAQAEGDEYRRAVLATRFPGVPCAEDVRDVRPDVAPVLLCGGFPCQDLSVAGRRAGLAGERSGLFFSFAALAHAIRPRFLLVENVPGLLSSNGGDDFRTVIQTLGFLGYGLAWRVLDSRFFGVPQRRRRVFIVGVKAVGRAGAERAGAILAVGSGCERHPSSREEAREVATGVAGAGADGPGRGRDEEGSLVVSAITRNGVGAGGGPDDNAAQAGHIIPTPPGVRRLTPVECERLQGFPDGWTDIPWAGKPHAPDSRRYAALGDAVTVPVAEWIGRRMLEAA